MGKVHVLVEYANTQFRSSFNLFLCSENDLVPIEIYWNTTKTQHNIALELQTMLNVCEVIGWKTIHF